MASHYEAWQRIRAKGRTHFIVTRGVLFFGGIMFVSMTAHNLIANKQESAIEHILYALMSLVIWPAAGYSWGVVMWKRFEPKYSNPNHSEISQGNPR
jgi:hypothetical protein